MVSPGLASGSSTAWLAWLPELGCTLANLHANSCLARSIASVSASSTYWQAAEERTAGAPRGVAPAGIPRGLLVGGRRAGGLQHRPADDVLRGDQLDLGALPPGL